MVKLKDQVCCNPKFSERESWKPSPLLAFYAGIFSDTVYVYRYTSWVNLPKDRDTRD